MKKSTMLVLVLLCTAALRAENKTDVSLKFSKAEKQESSISSETGNLYRQLAHHGPAIENEWAGFRLYFDNKVSVDVYNKTRPGLELAVGGWYPTVEQQKEGWGADQYKVGNTVGCGGVWLWDGEKAVQLNPVRMRTARVKKEANYSYMEMLSEGIPYKDRSIDVLVRVTVYSGIRNAKVEAFALTDEPVQFLTGLNFHKTTKVTQGKGYISSWGIHPEDVAAFQLEIGAAILYDANDFADVKWTDKEVQLISKPTKYLSHWIATACERESDLNSMQRFNAYLNGF
ncbi:MAG: DUF4861 family protein [Bacteroidales bacterium]|nr:DUF4861 family protein [Bacteroidales bacterium]MDD4770140.1 DUF4861 family protein [Bacteroidales bacterium]